MRALSLQKLNSPGGGTSSALAITPGQPGWAFAGTNAGVLRARLDAGSLSPWELLPESPLGVLCLSVSPNFDADHLLLAGTPDGIFISNDLGMGWKPAQMPVSGSTVLALAFTGVQDGYLAGTLEDGACVSTNGGKTWQSRNFGLLDKTVFALALSPVFVGDGTAFLGADSGLYHTYNHARAWQELPFPAEALPVLSLAIAPDFPADPAIFTGTETQGLWISRDHGLTWSNLALPATTVNALAFWEGALLAATEAGLYQSKDSGESWTCLASQPNALSLATSPDLALAGWADAGIMQSWRTEPWQPVSGFSSHTFMGLILAPRFPQDGCLLVYGPGEGLWLSDDAGANWRALSESLPFSEINHLIGYTKKGDDFSLLTASPEGLWLSHDGAQSWQQLLREPCTAAWASPTGQYLLAFLPQAGLRFSLDSGASWNDLPGAWQQGGRILACQVSDRQQLTIALLENLGEFVTFWQGLPGEMEEVLRLPAPANPVVSLWAPPGALPDRPWYASLGGQVWKFSSRRSGERSHSSILSELDRSEPIIALSGIQTGAEVELFACTGPRLYHSMDDAHSWLPIFDFGSRRTVSLNLKQTGQELEFYLLFLGGEIGLLS